MCQQGRSLFRGAGGSDSSAVGVPLLLEMCCRGALQDDQCLLNDVVNEPLKTPFTYISDTNSVIATQQTVCSSGNNQKLF